MVRSHAVLVSGLPILCQAPWSSEEAVVSVGQGQGWACSHQHPPLSSQEVAQPCKQSEILLPSSGGQVQVLGRAGICGFGVLI